MKIKLALLAALLLGSVITHAQNARFTFSGIIEYEKRVNIEALLKENNKASETMEAYLKSKPQFKVMKSILSFSRDRTRFDPGKGSEELIFDYYRFLLPEAEQVNIRYTDLDSHTFVSEKTVLGDIFLVRDTVRKINWKLTSEMRTIAGYECRRANAMIMDSVYVVAFYTTQIPVFGGPESFSGLPGMILGVALPREHTTWFATKVLDRDMPATEIKPPVKGKAADETLVKETVRKTLEDDKWGMLQRVLKVVLL